MVELLANIVAIIKNPNFYIPVIIIILLIIVGNFFKPIKSRMHTVLVSIGGIDIDWWSVSHIVLYIYFGYQFPNSFAEFLIIGSVWELIETFFCREKFERITNCTDSESAICRGMRKINSCDYWYGKIDDVAMNMIGFVIGAALAKRFKNIN